MALFGYRLPNGLFSVAIKAMQRKWKAPAEEKAEKKSQVKIER
jgi:hypothetical protein